MLFQHFPEHRLLIVYIVRAALPGEVFGSGAHCFVSGVLILFIHTAIILLVIGATCTALIVHIQIHPFPDHIHGFDAISDTTDTFLAFRLLLHFTPGLYRWLFIDIATVVRPRSIVCIF